MNSQGHGYFSGIAFRWTTIGPRPIRSILRQFAQITMVCLLKYDSMDRIDIIVWDFQVPVIAVFTKYDQFKRNIRMKLEDEGRDQEIDLNVEVESLFNQHYLASLNGPPLFVHLESEDHCLLG